MADAGAAAARAASEWVAAGWAAVARARAARAVAATMAARAAARAARHFCGKQRARQKDAEGVHAVVGDLFVGHKRTLREEQHERRVNLIGRESVPWLLTVQGRLHSEMKWNIAASSSSANARQAHRPFGRQGKKVGVAAK